MNDNGAVLSGYTKEVHGGGLFLLVKPDEDTQGQFRAWDMDNQEFIQVEGWKYSFVTVRIYKKN